MSDLGMYSQPQIRKKLNEKAIKKRIPLNGMFELTPMCNLNCKMCYIRMTEQEVKKQGGLLTAEQWIDLARECKDNGMLFLLLTGGEPFFRKDFKYIYEEIAKMGFVLTINSNGILIDEETINWLSKNPPSKINITLYGCSNETYEKLCMHPKGFSLVKRAVDSLMKAGIPVGINCSLTPYNIEDFAGIYQFCKDRKLQCRVNFYMFPSVRKSDKCANSDARLTATQAGRAMYQHDLLQGFSKETREILDRLQRRDCVIDDDVADDKMERSVDCIAGRCSFCITWNGKMSPCSMMNEPIAEPLENGFAVSWKHICDEVDKIKLPVECVTCDKRSKCKMCVALTMAENEGVSERKPEYLCEMVEEYERLWRCSEK